MLHQSAPFSPPPTFSPLTPLNSIFAHKKCGICVKFVSLSFVVHCNTSELTVHIIAAQVVTSDPIVHIHMDRCPINIRTSHSYAYRHGSLSKLLYSPTPPTFPQQTLFPRYQKWQVPAVGFFGMGRGRPCILALYLDPGPGLSQVERSDGGGGGWVGGGWDSVRARSLGSSPESC